MYRFKLNCKQLSILTLYMHAFCKLKGLQKNQKNRLSFLMLLANTLGLYANLKMLI